jgi:hypothetical protein
MNSTKQRAFLAERDNPSSRLDFHFNPTTISFGKSAKYERTPNQSGGAPPQYKGTESTGLSMKILLDAMEKQPDGSVLKEVEKLLSWTSLPKGPAAKNASPPELRFTWGSLTIDTAATFVGHLEKVDVVYQLFARDGRPLRAEVTLSLKATEQQPARQNPTSGSERSRRSRVLRLGETLQSLAYAVYGDAAAWRDIATVNDIDDPMRLRPGRELLLPDPAELTGSGR